jgi:hypothetical protein
MKNIIRYIKKEPVPVRLYAPGEPGQYEQLYWLVRFIQELKAQIVTLKQEKKALLFQVKGQEPLSKAEQEVLDLRYQVQMLWHENARLNRKCGFLQKRNMELNRELDQRDWEALLNAA